ncbi:MAG: dTDP-glucose 4,6-dehydratase [Acidimicrobiia bacterium]|nr:MAG: dTDP-glucose 4,6-dehydratase [Acidimicrobiia bacterium]
MSTRWLITGGAGFIGSNLVRHVLDRDADAVVTNLDLLTYAGVEATVAELDQIERHTFVRGDVRDVEVVDRLMKDADLVVHCAAETHVDRSITGPVGFLDTNVVGTGVVVDSARRHGVPRFVHVSTDEVYGSLAVGFASEGHRLDPSSPYSASKAGADLLVASYARTFGYPAIVTRCTNNFGPYQHPEKVIPRFVTNLLEGDKVPLYGDGGHERDWLHVGDHCRALALVAREGTPGEIYNIGADNHLTNLELTRRILAALGEDESMIEHVPDRPGHDRRYAVDSSKVRALGWRPEHDFTEHLESTIDWYRRRRDWWEPLRGASR